ncbi:hypothetical protein ACH44C_34535, partial [Streptomyces purpureus]|uniref:hypothetical protein n=1 Tax=Streptomyces purpureus TaxID=1951 RepID=UPI0037B09572
SSPSGSSNCSSEAPMPADHESTNPELSFHTRADWLAGFLRADRIRLDTLVQLVAGWGDDDTRDDVIAALDALAEIVQSPRTAEGALDAAAEAVEDAAGMDYAQIPIDETTTLRLSAELATVTARLTRFGPATRAFVPGQQDRRAAG